jgi:hypothetical protein
LQPFFLQSRKRRAKGVKRKGEIGEREEKVER